MGTGDRNDERAKLAKLAQIAKMIQDRDLAALAKANQACAQTRGLLEALGDPVDGPGEHPVADALALERHDHWRSHRRALLNMKLARETAVQITAHERAARAYGRARVLGDLLQGGPKRPGA